MKMKRTIVLIAKCLLLLLLITQVKTGYSQYVNLEVFKPSPDNIQETTGAPWQTITLDSLETSYSAVFGTLSRIRGFIIPPQTGYYKFNIAISAYGSFFYLSVDSNEYNKQLVCGTTGQELNTIIDSLYLETGKPYYFETFSTFLGEHNIQWSMPNNNQFQVIRGDYLKPATYPKQVFSVNCELFKNKTTYDFNTLRNTNAIPDEVDKLTTLNTPDHSTTLDHFASRIRGYIIPPISGNYSFYFAADDVGQFWLSTDTSSTNAQLKSEIFAPQTDWTQNVSTQNLIAGQRYFFEILQYDTIAADLIKLGWLIPGDTIPTVISTPYIMSSGENIPVSSFSLVNKKITAYPNWTIKLNYNLSPWNACNKGIQWISTNDSIATVNSDGKLTTIGVGNCKIIAKIIADSTLSDTLSLIVSDYYGPFFVKPNATGDGHTWGNAIDLQTLLNILNYSTISQNINIYVSEGKYKPTNTIDMNISFLLNNDKIRIVGGFDSLSTGTDTNLRNIINHETILSGDISTGGLTINSFHTVRAWNTVTIDGFTIRDGIACSPMYGSNSDYRGGGIDCEGGTTHIYNCKITNNAAWDGGGGIHTHCTVYINNSEICNNGTNQIPSSSGFFNIYVNCNGAGLKSSGGDIYVNNCKIYNNNSGPGYGPAFFIQHTNLYIYNSSIYKNTGTNQDIGIDVSSLILMNSTLKGGIFFSLGSATIRNSTIDGGYSTIGLDYMGATIDNSIWTNFNFEQFPPNTTAINVNNSILGNELFGSANNVIIDTVPNYTNWLDTLNYNGGLTPTMKLKNVPFNYAKTFGNPLYLDSTDQRGVIRKDSVSIGAYQWSSPMPKNQLNYVNWEIFKNKTSYDFNVLKNTDSIPDEVVKLTTINTPDHSTTLDHFASRIRGYIIPPYDGTYSFYFAADDVGQFWLSTDSSSANAQLKSNIQSIQTDWTQNISTQNLIAGQKYFFEILHYDTVYTDMIKLGWIIPGDTTPIVISTPYIVNGGDNVSISKFALLDKNVLAYPNWTITPRYQLTPWNASTDAIVWTSTDNTVATISTDGIITTQSAGTCLIIGKVATDTTLTDTLYLTVTDYYGPFFVKPNAIGDGHSWDNAIDLQTLLTIINRGTIQQQVTIYASEGTYKPTTTIDRNISFVFKNMRLVGGFPITNTGADTTNQDYTNHKTILSGEIGDPGTTIDNSYHVVRAELAIIDGVTISHGRASSSTYGSTPGYYTFKPDDNGGGICCYVDYYYSNDPWMVTLILKNCDISENSAWESGGGIMVWGATNGSNFLIENTDIHDNFTKQTIINSGGIFDIVVNGWGAGIATKGCQTYVNNCKLFNNHAVGNGGVFTGGNINLLNSYVFNNTSNAGGDFYLQGGYIRIDKSCIIGTVIGLFANPTIENSTIIGGVGISNSYDTWHFKNSTIKGNFNQFQSSLIFDNTIITDMQLVNFDTSKLVCQNSIIGNSLFGTSKDNIITDSLPNYSNWLDTLNYNGGLTPTMKLKNVPLNYAKTYGNPIYLDSTDQRGVIRKDSVSIGAYQWVKPTNISILPKYVTLCQSDSINVNIFIKPTYADDTTCIFTSTNDSIAYVNNSKIHAVSAGIVNIIAKTTDGGLPDTCQVIVIGKVGAGIITGPTNVCSDQNTVTYTVSSIANATSYVWTLPNGTLDTTIINSVYVSINTINQSGVLSVKGINSCGDGQTTTYSITVNPSYNLVVNKTICQGDSIIVGTHIYKTTGTFTDYLPTTLGCDSIITTHLTVNPIPQTPSITQTGNTLNSSALSGNQWYNATSGIISSATAQTYNPTTNGYYYIIVTLNGCSSDSSNHYYYSNVGIETNENNQTIKVYPNPVSNELIIELEGNKEKVTFEIFNSIGQIIYKGNLIEKTTVQTTNFAQGVYLIKLNNGKTFEFKKIVKE